MVADADRISLMLDSMVYAVENGFSYDGIVSIPETGLEDIGYRPGLAGLLHNSLRFVQRIAKTFQRSEQKAAPVQTDELKTDLPASEPEPKDSAISTSSRNRGSFPFPWDPSNVPTDDEQGPGETPVDADSLRTGRADRDPRKKFSEGTHEDSRASDTLEKESPREHLSRDPRKKVGEERSYVEDTLEIERGKNTQEGDARAPILSERDPRKSPQGKESIPESSQGRDPRKKPHGEDPRPESPRGRDPRRKYGEE